MTPDWYGALDRRDAAAARALCRPDVRMGGPQGASRGASQGHEVLTRWVEGSGIRLRPLARHDLGDGVAVMEEEATWDGGVRPPVRVFTLYAQRGGLLAAVLRHDSLDAARETARGMGRGL